MKRPIAGGMLEFDQQTHLAKAGEDYIPMQFLQIWNGERMQLLPDKYATDDFRLPPWYGK